MKTICRGCGAPLHNTICEYCGDSYEANSVGYKIATATNITNRAKQEDKVTSNFLLYKDTQFSPFFLCLVILFFIVFAIGMYIKNSQQ